MPSPQHQLLTRVIPVLRRRREVHAPDLVRRSVLDAQAAADPSPSRRVSRAVDVRRDEAFGLPVFEVSARGSRPTRSVLYLHGGGFVSGLDRLHWRYAARLARGLGVKVVLPAYPLTPTHTWQDALPPLLALFDEVAAGSPDGVVLMGDSAGGGLAVGLAQRLVARGGAQPSHLVAFAPWVDLTGDTPGTEQAALDDPWLTLPKLRLYGEWWGAGDPGSADASPLHGDLAGLPPTLLLCGTRDLLVPQSRLLADRAERAGTPLTYVEEPGLLHVYPLLPIPEARRAWRQVRAFL